MLGSLSEQGLESTNLELLARKSSPLDQITDVTNRLLERSNPIVLSKRTTIKKKLTCLECGSYKDTILGHSKTAMRTKKRYDSEVDELLVQQGS